MSKIINIPLGVTLRVKREDSSFENYVSQGSDEHGAIYLDSQGALYEGICVYLDIAIQTGSGWNVI